MTVASGVARVTVVERELGVTTPAGKGVYNAMALVAKRGPIVPTLITNFTQALSLYTLRGKIEVGDDLSLFVLKDLCMGSNKIWVNRAVSPLALYAGATIRRDSGATANLGLTAGVSDPNLFDLNTVGGKQALSTQLFTIDHTTGIATVPGALWGTVTTGEALTFTVGQGGTAPTGMTTATQYYVIKLNTPNQIKLASSQANAIAGTALSVTSDGVAPLQLDTSSRTVIDESDGITFAVFAKSPGAHGQNVSIQVVPYTGNESLVKEPGCFMVQVFNYGSLVEQLVCSRDPSARSLQGTTLYIEEVAKRSNYITMVDNVALDKSIAPKAQSNQLSLAGGDDGEAITDADMIRAVTPMNAAQQYYVTAFNDSGWTTVNYLRQLESMCEARGDVVYLHGYPVELEQDSDYLNQIVNFRQDTYNSVSSYGASYTPHGVEYDPDNDRNVIISPVGAVAARLSITYDTYSPWEPAAGLEKGALTNFTDLIRRFDDGQLSYLYDSGINPIRFKRGAGIHIWGQKTNQVRSGATDRLNVRMLLTYLKPILQDGLEPILFRLNQIDNNDLGIRAEVKSIVDSRMLTVKARRGVYDFKTICDSTNNSGQDVDDHVLNVWLLLKPAKSIEYINLILGLTPTAVDFTLAETLI